jgi:hypothetical protein
MNRLNFEDSIFILNMRIRIIRDTLHLNPPPELFLEKSLDDLAFVNGALEVLVKTITENSDQYNGNNESEYISDTEWQFNQVLTEFLLESSPFSAHARPETMQQIAVMRASSEARRKIIDETGHPLEIAQSEPVVTSAELNGLLGGV